jgi:nitroimidazol reductase NimA-like FMN-containing flavoprotein (pyridoxamine 5'-phosphate oxidase superfamily)
VHDAAALHQILDEALVAHLGISVDGQPYVLPMACARDGDSLLLHGSAGSRLLIELAAGIPACATITLLDGLVYARSAFESSMHYRSALLLGVAHTVPPTEKETALDVLTEHLLPGRRGDLRRSTRKELAATHVVRLPIEEWSVKINAAPPQDPPGDLDADIWAGVLPLQLQPGLPVDAPDLRVGKSAPTYVTTRRW